MSEETPWRRLHPSSVWVNALPRTFKFILAFWWILLFAFFSATAPDDRSISSGGLDVDVQSTASGVGSFELFLILAILGSGLVTSFIHYTTLRYRLHDGMLEIRHGLLNRRSRKMDPRRIQNIEIVRNPLHQMTGLCELRVETAGEAREDGLLSALDDEEANRLRLLIEQLRNSEVPEEETDEDGRILEVGLAELIAYGLSSSLATYAMRLLFVLVAAQYLLEAKIGFIEQLKADLGTAFVLSFMVIAVAAAVLFGVIQGVFRHWGHVLSRDPGGVRTQEGFFTLRKVEVPHKKIQVLKVKEPILRRWMGYGTLHVETAGLGSVKEGVYVAETVVPMVHQSELSQALSAASPQLDLDPWDVRLDPPARNALTRDRIAIFIPAAVVMVASMIAFYPFGFLSLLLIPWLYYYTGLYWRKQGWKLTDKVLVVQRGVLLRDTRVMAREKVQAVHVVHGPLMRWQGIARVHVLVADASVQLPDLPIEECRRIQEKLRDSVQ